MQRLALRDIPSEDEFGIDKTFPHLLPENFTRGISEIFLNPVDEHGVSLAERQRLQRQVRAQKHIDLQMQKHMDETFDSIDQSIREELGLKPVKKTKKESGTVTAKKAASALSGTGQPRRLVTSTTARPRANAPLNVRKPQQPGIVAPNPTSVNHTTAAAASKSTLGYAQGRAISQKVRKPIASVFRDGQNNTISEEDNQSQASAPLQSASDEEYSNQVKDIVSRLRMQGLNLEDDESDDDLMGKPVNFEDEDNGNFQFSLPTGN